MDVRIGARCRELLGEERAWYNAALIALVIGWVSEGRVQG